MKTCVAVVSLLLLSLLFSHAQGIRLDKESFVSNEHKLKVGEEVAEIVCKDGDDQCSYAGKTRKLNTIFHTYSTSATTSKKNGEFIRGQEKAMHVHSPAKSSGEQFPEIVDIAEMDYSPARRKPPIHN